jgi:hypothetical protein
MVRAALDGYLGLSENEHYASFLPPLARGIAVQNIQDP